MHRLPGIRRVAVFMSVLGVLAAVYLSAVVGGQDRTDSQRWSELTARLERAAMNGATVDLRAVRAELLRALTPPSVGEREALIQYAIAYVAWRMAFLPDAAEREKGDLLEDGVKRLQAVVKADPKNAEAHALLGGLYGSQTGRSPMSGMLLGPRASAVLARAAELAPENPRVAVQLGIGAFNTPAMFGGSVDRAERSFRQSVTLLAKEAPDKLWPNWGRFDAHVWLGQVLLQKGDRAGARAEYDQALAIAPGSGWLRFDLIPALERAAKR